MWLLAMAVLPAFLYPAICIAYRQRLEQKRLELKGIMAHDEQNRTLYKEAFGINTDELFVNSFGVVAYAVPVLTNAICVWTITLIFLTRHGLDVWLPSNIAAFAMRLPRSVVAGFVGAFVWGMYDALRRYRAASLSPESLHFTWLRMLIAGSLAPFLAALFNNSTGGDALAFGLGAFPAKTLSDLVQGQSVVTASKTCGYSESAAPSNCRPFMIWSMARLKARGMSKWW